MTEASPIIIKLIEQDPEDDSLANTYEPVGEGGASNENGDTGVECLTHGAGIPAPHCEFSDQFMTRNIESAIRELHIAAGTCEPEEAMRDAIWHIEKELRKYNK